MVAAFIPPTIITVIWFVVGVIGPIFAKGPNRGIIQCCLMLTAVCCWLFWLCCYMTQMNPLIGPNLSRNSVLIIAREWGNEITENSTYGN